MVLIKLLSVIPVAVLTCWLPRTPSCLLVVDLLHHSMSDLQEHEDMEKELEAQLAEQQEALEGVKAALQEEGGSENQELQEMANMLEAAINEIESALLEFARARLLSKLAGHSQFQTQDLSTTNGGLAQAQQPITLYPPGVQQTDDASTGTTAGPSAWEPHQGVCKIAAGTGCRFRGPDGRWYAGWLDQLLADGWAVVHYKLPTQQHMCEGYRVPASSLRPARAPPYIPLSFEVGDVVYIDPGAIQQHKVILAGHQQGVWPAGDVVEVDEISSKATVRLQGGRSIQLDYASLTLSADAGCSDLCSDSEASSSSDDSDNDSQSEGTEVTRRKINDQGSENGQVQVMDVMAHARAAVAAGINTTTVHFAGWEAHTRGIASKLLAGMGYTAGRGLGSTGRGISAPVEAVLLPAKAGLGSTRAGQQQGTDEDEQGTSGQKHKSKRGGERKRRKRRAAAAYEAREAARNEGAAREAQGGAPGLFGFINTALGDASEAAAKIRAVESSLLKQDRVRPEEGGTGSKAGGRGSNARPDSRQRLMDQHKAIEACQAKVAHFQGMLARNKSNAGLAPQIAAKLRESQAELAAAQSEQSRMNAALKNADARKQVIKF